MLGLSLEKLILIGIIAAVVIGPERLPRYAAKLGELIRSFRDFTAASKAKAESELGMSIDTAKWNRQVRQYDPRTIVKDAWTGDVTPAGAPAPEGATVDDPAEGPDEEPTEEPAEEPAPAMRERWVVVGGSSGHPIRRKILEPVPVEKPEDEPDDEPTESTTSESVTLDSASA
ncbi:MAG: twin-arginine translocase TatA/TatE family subunit [Corynebacterium variabile]|uniref:Sec-independent protein translocase subunit TatA/TatB n=1 Tax=Corynebacterium variabile TaxID=1727 RepID=UPI0026490BD8|nr:twin-arginine translocase TatA/TatE family subunit [Corynebacterium variabile]MDN6477549.1 twin-arginine translocase TatA/TatE family subunit [Corynebacterium variabile]MDN6618041.1 twin-arginine translocase TatA/TatE family subunit [Corynebacterium variabile]MDN6814842.1 twin-arginine translocase TatA/TatE family subunit [Corynebacterium variabile]MDN6843832.1 twin-arginine translocase TatA/TatE family subunit [Corynebacterium variabile]